MQRDGISNDNDGNIYNDKIINCKSNIDDTVRIIIQKTLINHNGVTMALI